MGSSTSSKPGAPARRSPTPSPSMSPAFATLHPRRSSQPLPGYVQNTDPSAPETAATAPAPYNGKPTTSGSHSGQPRAKSGTPSPSTWRTASGFHIWYHQGAGGAI